MNEQDLSNRMEEIMSKIRTRRLELDMSYQDLADKTGLSKSTLQRYETGSIKNMPLDKLEDVAKALYVEPSYLMGWEEPINQTIAAHKKDNEQWSNEELSKIEEYKQLLLAARNNKR